MQALKMISIILKGLTSLGRSLLRLREENSRRRILRCDPVRMRLALILASLQNDIDHFEGFLFPVNRQCLMNAVLFLSDLVPSFPESLQLLFSCGILFCEHAGF